ncbi:MAG TPA: hypothetical protein VKT77_21555 [Chthonomonadaceae bacterium]|nr:hypothetical protein [Chthonomonadaceae bacterium]
MITVYEQRGIEKGIVQGIEQGIERGIEQGVVRGKRESLLRQLATKFGAVPDPIAAAVEAMADSSELQRLSDLILSANTIEEMFPKETTRR